MATEPEGHFERHVDGRRDRDEVEEARIPLAEERLVTGRRERTVAKVRVHKRVTEREEIVDEPVRREAVEVRRVPVNRFVDEVSGPREEDGTLIVPVYEEVLVTERRLRLKEEVHLVRTVREERHPERVVLRGEEIDVTREEVPPDRNGASRRDG